MKKGLKNFEHHPDCDGYRMHSVKAYRNEYGTWNAECPLCGPLPIIGSSGTPELAVSLCSDHSGFSECAGECETWT